MAFTRSQILTFFWASASWTLHPKPSLIENQSLQKKSLLTCHMTSLDSSLAVLRVMVLPMFWLLCIRVFVLQCCWTRGGSIKTPSSILIYSDAADFHFSKFKHQLLKSLLSRLRTSRWQAHPAHVQFLSWEFLIHILNWENSWAYLIFWIGKKVEFLWYFKLETYFSISNRLRHLDKSNKEHNKKVTRTIWNCALGEPRNAGHNFSSIWDLTKTCKSSNCWILFLEFPGLWKKLPQL